MNFSKTKIAACFVTAFFQPLSGGASAPEINISSRSRYLSPQIIVRSIYDFEQDISLKIKSDPALKPSEALIKLISKFGMTDAKGIKITSGFDINLANDIVLGFSGGTSEIIKAAGSPVGIR